MLDPYAKNVYGTDDPRRCRLAVESGPLDRDGARSIALEPGRRGGRVVGPLFERDCVRHDAETRTYTPLHAGSDG